MTEREVFHSSGEAAGRVTTDILHFPGPLGHVQQLAVC